MVGHCELAEVGYAVVLECDGLTLAGGDRLDVGGDRGLEGVVAEAVSERSGRRVPDHQEQVVRAAIDHVVFDGVAFGQPEVLVDEHSEGDAGKAVVGDQVAGDQVVVASGDHDSAAEADVPVGALARCVLVAVVVDVVADDHDVALGRQFLAVEGVGHHADPVAGPLGVLDDEVAAGVGARIPEGVVLGYHVADHGVARVALADVEGGVGVAAAVAVLDEAVGGVEGVDAVEAVVVGGHVRGPVAVNDDVGAVVAGEEHAVRGVRVGGEVLDGHAVREDDEPVLAFVLAVDDHGVAVGAADDDVVGFDDDGLVVGARADQDQVAGLGGVDGLLDGGVVVRHHQGIGHRINSGGRRRRFGRRGRFAGAVFSCDFEDGERSFAHGYATTAAEERVEAETSEFDVFPAFGHATQKGHEDRSHDFFFCGGLRIDRGKHFGHVGDLGANRLGVGGHSSRHVLHQPAVDGIHAGEEAGQRIDAGLFFAFHGTE